jgi:hypothetical protein
MHQWNQINCTEQYILFTSPLHILELEEVISIVKCSCKIEMRLRLFSWLLGASESEGSVFAKSSWSIKQEENQLIL